MPIISLKFGVTVARTKTEKVKKAKPLRDAEATQAVILAAAEAGLLNTV